MERQIALDRDHSDICKFHALDDDAYLQVEGNIVNRLRWEEHSAIPPALAPASPAPAPALPHSLRPALRRRRPSFADLTGSPRHLAAVPPANTTATAAYWRRLTLASYEIYEALYEACRDRQQSNVSCKVAGQLMNCYSFLLFLSPATLDRLIVHARSMLPFFDRPSSG
jgi:hypothetical protein